MVDVFDGVDNDALMIDDCNGECRPRHPKGNSCWSRLRTATLSQVEFGLLRLQLSFCARRVPGRVCLRSNCDQPVQLAAPLAR